MGGRILDRSVKDSLQHLREAATREHSSLPGVISSTIPLTQIERILEINSLQAVTKTVVEAARESLVIGQT